MTGEEAAIRRLAEALALARRECEALTDTRARLFPSGMAERADWLAGISQDPARGDMVEAFAARFARFQEGLGAKVLPLLLRALGEPVGPLLDNLDRAQRFGWIDDPEAWLAARALRNRLVHEYARDTEELAAALNAAGRSVGLLLKAFRSMVAAAAARGWAPPSHASSSG